MRAGPGPSGMPTSRRKHFEKAIAFLQPRGDSVGAAGRASGTTLAEAQAAHAGAVLFLPWRTNEKKWCKDEQEHQE